MNIEINREYCALLYHLRLQNCSRINDTSSQYSYKHLHIEQNRQAIDIASSKWVKFAIEKRNMHSTHNIFSYHMPYGVVVVVFSAQKNPKRIIVALGKFR